MPHAAGRSTRSAVTSRRSSRRAQRAVAVARTAGDLVAVVVQPVGGVEHAARARRARAGAPLRARALDGACARAIGVAVEHAAVGRRARTAEVEARAGATRQAREVT